MADLITNPLTTHLVLSIIMGTFFVWFINHTIHIHHISVFWTTIKTIISYGFFLLSGWIGGTTIGISVENFVHPNPAFHLTAAVRAFVLSWVALILINYFILKCRGKHVVIASGIASLATTALYIPLLLPAIAAHPIIVCWYFQC